MTIGDRIRVKREETGLSQEELAKLTDTTKQAIYKYEKGIVVNIPLSRLEKLGKVLNCTPAYIMGWTEDETRELSPKEKKFIEFGARIRQKRLDLNMTQEELAKRCGYTSRSSINKIELGLVDLPQSKIATIAKVLNVQPAYLVGWTDDENRQISDKEKEFIEAVKNMSDDEIDKMNDYLSFILSKRK